MISTHGSGANSVSRPAMSFASCRYATAATTCRTAVSSVVWARRTGTTAPHQMRTGTIRNLQIIAYLLLVMGVSVHARHLVHLHTALAGAHRLEADKMPGMHRSEEHTSELQSQSNLVCR